MNETQTNAPEVEEVAPAAAPEAEVQQPALVAPQPAAKVKGKFDEQLGLMLPSDAAQVQEQLSMPGMNDDMVYKIVETHSGNHAVLYKTYDQAVLARDVRDSIENAGGHKVLPIAKAKLGSTYCKGEFSTEQGCKGDSETFGNRSYRGDVRHRGPHGALLPHELHYGQARPQQGQGSGTCGQGRSGTCRRSQDNRPRPLRLGSERQERPSGLYQQAAPGLPRHCRRGSPRRTPGHEQRPVPRSRDCSGDPGYRSALPRDCLQKH